MSQERCMMSEKESREEVLDLLARGKISIDEAVDLLDRSAADAGPATADEPLYKAEMDQGFDGEDVAKIKISEEFGFADQPETEDMSTSIKQKGNSQQPRWLRVQVLNSETGKSKVTVNVPFAMVKFGLGVARVFSPEMKGVDLDEVGELFNNAEPGILVDVQDDESNEHVKVFFE